jgi:NAD(P)-dependent dehydrogenase (short-subunit alcohol dehydrogenase family)
VTRRALVTGASGAFGSAVCAELRSRGWRVAALDLAFEGDEEDSFVCDVTSDAEVASVVPRAIAHLGGGVDAVIANAGIGGPASAGEPPSDRVRQMLDVNLLGAWRVVAASIDSLVESRASARACRSSACRWARPTASRSAR